MVSLSDESVKQSLISRLSHLEFDSTRRWGRMTAPQMICHLNDSFLVSMGERKAASKANLFSRTVMRYVALQMPARWPRNIRTLPEVEQGVGGTCPTDFGLDRAALLRNLDRFCVPDPTLGKYPHPLFGLMSVPEWLRWGYLHCDHHFRQFGI
jgi:hypothetical protein